MTILSKCIIVMPKIIVNETHLQMKKIIILSAILMATNPIYAQKPQKIIVEMNGKKYVLSEVDKPPLKKTTTKQVQKNVAMSKIDSVHKTDSTKATPKTSIYSQYANGNIVVNGTVNGNITVNIVHGDTTKVSAKLDTPKSTPICNPAPKKPIEVVRTRAYSIFLDARKNEKIRPKQYQYVDYEPTNNFRRIKRRMKKALYPLESGAGASEFMLTEAGQNLLNLRNGVHNIINVRNAGVVDIYKLGDTLIADFKPDRYSATDYTGGMRIFYRK